MDVTDDVVKSSLKKVAEGRSDLVEDKAELKKRKLVEEVTEKVYVVRKGRQFSTTIDKVATDITPEMISNGSFH